MYPQTSEKEDPFNCTQVKNISSFIDNQFLPEDQKRIEYHLQKCPVCQIEKQKCEEKNLLLRAYIPDGKISLESKEQLDTEVKEICKHFRNKIDQIHVSKIKDARNFMIGIEKTLAKIVFSKEMVKYYMISVIMGITLKLFLS